MSRGVVEEKNSTEVQSTEDDRRWHKRREYIRGGLEAIRDDKHTKENSIES